MIPELRSRLSIVMMHLHHHPGDSLRGISDGTGISREGCARFVAVLKAEGWVSGGWGSYTLTRAGELAVMGVV